MAHIERIQTGKVDGFNSEKPEQCGFFVGDEKKSHFVSADKAFVLDDVKNGRWKYFAYEDEAGKIVDHLKKSKNILEELRKKVKEFENQTNKERHEKRCKTC